MPITVEQLVSIGEQLGSTLTATQYKFELVYAVLRIRIRIRMNPHGFGLLDPHPESAFQMRIPDADADPG